MKRIQIHYDGPEGVDGGLKKLSEYLRKLGIPEKNIINVIVSHEATYFVAFIREDETLKICEDMKAQIYKADDLLHQVSMTLSSGQALTHEENVVYFINDYLAEYQVKKE